MYLVNLNCQILAFVDIFPLLARKTKENNKLLSG